MKRLAFFLSLLIITIYSYGQWELQNPFPTDAELYDIYFTDSVHGWAVGLNGTILFTDDGGISWQLQLSLSGPAVSTFTSVYFTDLLNGWAVGSSYIPYGGVWASMIYHTEDGGNSWEEQYSNPTEGFLDVWFINSDTGWVVGSESYESDGIILFTSDGGYNWVEQYRKDSLYLNEIFFVDPTIGWAVGAQGLIVSTSDGGTTWVEQNSTVENNLSSINFVDLNNGWAIGGKVGFPAEVKILHSEDGGTNWGTNKEFGDYEGYQSGSIFFTDKNNGWATLCDTDYHWFIYKTSDGGDTWNSYSPGIYLNKIPSLYFINPNHGWAVGSSVIIQSVDGGQTWEPQNTVSNSHFTSVCFIDENNGWAAGSIYSGNYISQNTIVNTTDGGSTWEVISEWSTNYPYRDIFFIDNEHGWAIRSSSTFEESMIERTIDGGLNWLLTEFNFELSSIHFSDSLNGWAIGLNGKVLKTEDGGATWEEQTSGTTEGLVDLYFTDLSNGWIVGGERIILHTSNGGESWETQSIADEGYLKSVCFIDEDHGWAIGEWEIIPNNSYDIIYTSDGGDTWEQSFITSDFDLNDIYFTDLMNGWAVGRSGTIISTNNGGVNWVIQESESSNNLNSIQLIDSQEGWAVGNNGTILYTSNGGTVGFENISTRNPNLNIHCYPNPFSTSTTIEYTIPHPQTVTITFYNQFGKEVDRIEQKQSAGKKQMVWAPDLPGGVYYYRLKAGEKMASGKLVLVR